MSEQTDSTRTPLVSATWLNTDGHETFAVFSHETLWYLILSFIVEVSPTSKISLIPEENFYTFSKNPGVPSANGGMDIFWSYTSAEQVWA